MLMTSNFVFLSSKSRDYQGKKYIDVNIESDDEVYTLRHNFATNYCLDQYERYGQVDIYRLMVLMGHEDVATTRRYLHFANQMIASRGVISHLDQVFFPET